MVSRRTLLQAMGATLAAFGMPEFAIAERAGEELFAAALMEDGRYGIAIMNGDGLMLRHVALPGRGHDITADGAGRWLVAFARRPGTFALAIDRKGQAEPLAFNSPADRHFYGHGVFLQNDRLLVATENDYENGRGILGLYDATDDFRRIGEWSSHGIGPHDLALAPDGETLVVANGGMETHPAYGREALNLAAMEPSLVFLDARDGALKEKHGLPQHWARLSTRHMDIARDGRVFVGCQWQGAEAECPPLLLSFRQGEGRRDYDLGQWAPRLSAYVGSVAVNRDADRVAITSPHGDLALVLNAADGAIIDARRQVDVCGAAPMAGDFITSTGTGLFGTRQNTGIAFDNHILSL